MDVILNNVNPIMASIRIVFVMLDYCVYFLLRVVIDVFFNIATYNFIDREMIFNLFSRVQLIIGIFMVFQLTMTIIKGIVNPDSFTDAKTGFGNVVMRIIVSLALLALIVPLNISSPKNEYETQINNNGVLFGTLYSLQSRILKNNTIGRLILGDSEANYTSSDDGSKEGLGTFADRFMNVIVKTFYQLNVDEDGNYVCDDGFDEEYNDADISPFAIIWHGVEPCGYSGAAFVSTYQLSMSYLISTIGVGILVVLFLMITFNVAKRVFQLAALQLMAPIPIISYMDPKGSKDSAFNAWLKLLGTTYLELFIQLAVIYFAIGVINSFLDKFGDFYLTTTINTATGDTGTFVIGMLTVNPVGLSFFVMTVALFIFAKDAPKFFKQMLGVKDDGKGFFSAFGTAMGIGVAAAGALGSFQASRQGSRDADIARGKAMAKQRGLTGEDVTNFAESYANRFGNRAKHGISGLFGAGSGLITGSAAASESKGNAMAKMMASVNAMNTRNQKVREAGLNGGTFFGGVGSLGQEIIEGQNSFDALDAKLKASEQKIKDQELVNKRDADINSYRKAIMDRVNSKAVDKVGIVGEYKVNDKGYTTIKGNYRDWHSTSQAALVNGVGVYERKVIVDGVVQKNADGTDKMEKVFDYDGQQIRVADVEYLDFGMLDASKEAYYQKAITDATFDTEVWENKESYEKLASEVNGTPVTIEDNWGINGNGIKAKFGETNRRLSKSNGELSRQREAINAKRQEYQGTRAQYNAKRFRK